jgi:hypothetical protein
MLSSTRRAKRRSSSRARPGGADGDVVLLGVAQRSARCPRPAAGARGEAGGPALRRRIPSAARAHLHHLLVLDAAGRGDHDVAREVALAVEGLQLLARRRARRPRRARASRARAGRRGRSSRRARRRSAPGVVLVHRDLLEHDLALLGEPSIAGARSSAPSRRRRARDARRARARTARSSPCRCRRSARRPSRRRSGRSPPSRSARCRGTACARAGARAPPAPRSRCASRCRSRSRARPSARGHALGDDAHATGQLGDDVRALQGGDGAARR